MASVLEKTIRAGVTAGITGLAGLNRKRLSGDNAFMTGIHTPMDGEKTLTHLQVTGTIPTELDGRYVRIGPNPQYAEAKGYHWFTGDGMVHGIRIEDCFAPAGSSTRPLRSAATSRSLSRKMRAACSGVAASRPASVRSTDGLHESVLVPRKLSFSAWASRQTPVYAAKTFPDSVGSIPDAPTVCNVTTVASGIACRTTESADAAWTSSSCPNCASNGDGSRLSR